MVTTIASWGNSHAVRLSRAIMEQAHLQPHDRISISVAPDQSITIHKVSMSKAEKFLELFGDFSGDWSCTEADTGSDLGKEVFD